MAMANNAAIYPCEKDVAKSLKCTALKWLVCCNQQNKECLDFAGKSLYIFFVFGC
jgi:hypothetical protein